MVENKARRAVRVNQNSNMGAGQINILSQCFHIVISYIVIIKMLIMAALKIYLLGRNQWAKGWEPQTEEVIKYSETSISGLHLFMRSVDNNTNIEYCDSCPMAHCLHSSTALIIMSMCRVMWQTPCVFNLIVWQHLSPFQPFSWFIIHFSDWRKCVTNECDYSILSCSINTSTGLC